MSKRFSIVRGVTAFVFGSTAMFFRPTLLPDDNPSPSYPSRTGSQAGRSTAALGWSSAAAASSRSTARSRSRP